MLDKATTIAHTDKWLDYNIEYLGKYSPVHEQIIRENDIPFYITKKLKGINATFWIDYKDPSAILYVRIKQNGYIRTYKVGKNEITTHDTIEQKEYLVNDYIKQLIRNISNKITSVLLRICPQCVDNYMISGVFSDYKTDKHKLHVHTIYNETKNKILPLCDMLSICNLYKLKTVPITTDVIFINNWSVKSLKGLAVGTNGLVFTPVGCRYVDYVNMQFLVEDNNEPV